MRRSSRFLEIRKRRKKRSTIISIIRRKMSIRKLLQQLRVWLMSQLRLLPKQSRKLRANNLIKSPKLVLI